MTPRHWVFIAARPFLPETDDPFATGLGGTEQAIIHLATALATLGQRVTVSGGSAIPRDFAGVAWRSGPPPACDVTIAINDARLLPRAAANPVIWFHNEVAFGKELRRRRLGAILRHRPTAIFIGSEQARAASPLLPFRRRLVIPYGLSEPVLTASPAAAPPPPAALFTSQAYRGLAPLIAAWQRDIAPAVPMATLTAYVAGADLAAFRALATSPGITISPRIGNAAVLAQLRRTRLLLAPGHVSETFCLAAAEAIALGVPVVTLGIGSLKERVRDGIDGFICRDYRALAARTCALLTDDALWRRMHEVGIATRVGRSWRDVAKQWQAQFP